MTQTQTKPTEAPGSLTDGRHGIRESEHIERDLAKIPAPFLSHPQIRDLQAEVMRLRLKRRHQREAIASLNRAHERHLYLLSRSNADRNVLSDEYNELVARYRQLKG